MFVSENEIEIGDFDLYIFYNFDDEIGEICGIIFFLGIKFINDFLLISIIKLVYIIVFIFETGKLFNLPIIFLLGFDIQV